MYAYQIHDGNRARRENPTKDKLIESANLQELTNMGDYIYIYIYIYTHIHISLELIDVQCLSYRP